MEHQRHFNSDFFNGDVPWSTYTQCIWQDSGKVVFSTCSLTQLLGSGGGWRAAWLLDFHHLVASEVGREKCRLTRQVETAHQQPNDTTDDRPRGKPRTPSPSAWRLPNGSCSNGKLSRLECLALSGVFLFDKQSFIQRTLPGKEWKGTKGEWTWRKETYHSRAVLPGEKSVLKNVQVFLQG